MNRVLSAILPYFEFALQFAPLFFRALPRPRLGATLGSLAVTINVKPLGTLTAFPVGFICGAGGGVPNIHGGDERSWGHGETSLFTRRYHMTACKMHTNFGMCFYVIENKVVKVVEAVGVEPTSENVTGQEPTYLVQFTRRELPRQIRVLRLERTRNANR